MPKHATLGVDGKVPADQLPAGGPGGGVTTVFGRAGDVVAATNDYTFAQLASKPTTLSGYGITDAQPLAAVLTNTTASYTTTLDSKLSGIATGAEVNVNADWNSGSGDSQILNKPTLGGAAALNVGTTTGTVSAGDHTHTAAGITDFTEVSQDVIGAMIVAAGGTYDDAGGTISLPGVSNIPQSLRTITGNETIAAGKSAIVIRKFTIASGIKLIVGSAATMRIL